MSTVIQYPTTALKGQQLPSHAGQGLQAGSALAPDLVRYPRPDCCRPSAALHSSCNSPCYSSDGKDEFGKAFAEQQSSDWTTDSYLEDRRHLQGYPDNRSRGKRRHNLAQKAFYTTSTQKLYQGAGWPNRMMPSPPLLPAREPRPDMVSLRSESTRYEPDREIWQEFGSRPFSWDYVQTRDGHLTPGPVQFCSPSKRIVHVPGYMGHVSGGPGEMDSPRSKFTPTTKLSTLKPRYSDTARRANIPGYTGCVLYCDYQPACVNDSNHMKSTASRTYRDHNEVRCNNKSPFKRTSSMSRMVTLTHPFNPFNKVH